MTGGFKSGAVISYLTAALLLGLGLHKMFAYEAPETIGSSILLGGVNAYVGGDAYNYIINANYATAFFTLSIFCAVIGLTFIVAGYLSKRSDSNRNIDIPLDGEDVTTDILK